MKILLVVLFLWGASVSLAGQTSDWERLRRLAAGTRVHVATDNRSKTCSVDLIDEATLRCSKGASQYSFLRADVKSVKLTRYGRSTLVGLGIGLGGGRWPCAGEARRPFPGAVDRGLCGHRRRGGCACRCGDWRAYRLSARAYGVSAALIRRGYDWRVRRVEPLSARRWQRFLR
jgi:hypothetical protein